jgi:hypothetical protein
LHQTAKDPVSRLRDSPQNGRKFLPATHLIRDYYPVSTGNSKTPQRIKTSMKKWAHELNREFSKEEVQMTDKLHEEVFNFPGCLEMLI